MQHLGVPLLALALAFSVASCGGGGAGAAPAARFVVASHGSADFAPDTDIPDACPDTLGFSIFLEEDGTGWVSLEHEQFGSRMFEVSWQKVGLRYEVATQGEVRVSYFTEYDGYSIAAELGWEDLTFTATDDDADDTAESGTADATLICDWSVQYSWDTVTKEVSFDLGDGVSPATLEFDDGGVPLGVEPMFRSWLFLEASSPLLAQTLPGDLRLLVDGVPVEASIEVTQIQGPFARSLRILPAEVLDFGATVSLAATVVLDAFGQPVELEGAGFETIADPGPVTDNPSFEGSGGWIGAHVENELESFPAAHGTKHAVLSPDHGNLLVGYFDVPDDATSLSVEVGLENALSDIPGMSVFTLITPNGSRDLWPDTSGCNEYPWGCTIPWTTIKADLSDVRGERVMLRAWSSRLTFMRPDIYDTLHIDFLRVE
jgi:hypothetical protein